MNVNGYEMKTTFWNDFTIADAFGISAVKDTYKRAFAEWKIDYVYLAELVMVLNWKMWAHYETNEALARVYNDLWMQADYYAYSTLEGEEFNYFITVTD